MADRPWKRYRHKPTVVMARPVTGTKVIKTPHGGKIALNEEDGDWEILGLGPQPSHYGNTAQEFEDNYEEEPDA